MRRYLPFAIIVAVFLSTIGSGLILFRWKQPTSAPTAPISVNAPVMRNATIFMRTGLDPPE